MEALKSQFPVVELHAPGDRAGAPRAGRVRQRRLRQAARQAGRAPHGARRDRRLVPGEPRHLLPAGHAHGAGGASTPCASRWTAWRWFSITGSAGQSIPIDVAFGVDAMSAIMMLVVTGVGFLIHLYSTEYMKKDPGFHRFFAYLNLFCFAMLVLIMADNMAVLFVGWEGVGLCSYLLIGFWFGEEKNATAGKKAFIVNRIGDFGLLLAMAMIAYYCGTLQVDGHGGHRQPACSIRSRSGPSATSRARRSRTSSPTSSSPRRPSRSTRRRWWGSPSSSAAPARARRSRSTSGSPTPWPARRRSPRSSTRPPW